MQKDGSVIFISTSVKFSLWRSCRWLNSWLTTCRLNMHNLRFSSVVVFFLIKCNTFLFNFLQIQFLRDYIEHSSITKSTVYCNFITYNHYFKACDNYQYLYTAVLYILQSILLHFYTRFLQFYSSSFLVCVKYVLLQSPPTGIIPCFGT